MYCSATEVRQMIPKIVANILDNDEVEAQITRADNMINGYVGSRYTIPFTDAPNEPPLIGTISSMLASYFVMLSQFSQDSQNKNEWVSEFKSATKQLELIAAGKITVVDSTGAELAFASEPVESNNQEYPAIMDVDATENQVISPNRLEDIASERDT